MNRICTICARGGSRGVRNKNIRYLAGMPLIAHSLEQARNSALFEVIAVSSDSAEIRNVALAHGADVVVERPLELASDTSAKLPAIRHCVEEVERTTGRCFGVVVDLDVTSPLRWVEDIREAVALLESKGLSNVITAAPARRSPYFNLVEVDSEGRVVLSKPPSSAVLRRQDSPACYDMNASIYVWRRDRLFDSDSVLTPQTRLMVMPEERSHDIDSELDFDIVEFLMTRSGVGSHDE